MGGGMKRPGEREGWTTGMRGGRSGDNRSPPVKKSDTRPSPTSSKASSGSVTSPIRYEMTDRQEEEEGEEMAEEEEDDDGNTSGEADNADNLDEVEYRVVGVEEARMGNN